MFCPQCSQQQLSNEVRFCPKCGLPLTGVSQLLANGGNLSVVEKPLEKKKCSPRKEGYRQGFILILICFVLAPLSSLSKHLDVIPSIFIMAGFARLLYARFFQDADPQEDRKTFAHPSAVPQMNAPYQSTYLPPVQVSPVSNFPSRRIDTAEIVERPSVTEHTTKLLDPEPRS